MRFQKVLTIAMFTLTLGAAPLLYGQELQPDDPTRGAARLDRPATLVGSWLIDVHTTATPPFQALHTFHVGGTMSETTEALATLSEGPAQGAWERNADGYATTFELFIFNPDHTPAGRIRVRESIALASPDRLTGFAVADLILPDGTVIENIDNGPLTGERISVVRVREEELAAPPANAVFSSWRR